MRQGAYLAKKRMENEAKTIEERSSVRCLVCNRLHDEYSVACEAEATVSLQQRYQLIQPEGAGPETSQKHQEDILSSRLRQLKIASRLEQHRTLAHSA